MRPTMTRGNEQRLLLLLRQLALSSLNQYSWKYAAKQPFWNPRLWRVLSHNLSCPRNYSEQNVRCDESHGSFSANPTKGENKINACHSNLLQQSSDYYLGGKAAKLSLFRKVEPNFANKVVLVLPKELNFGGGGGGGGKKLSSFRKLNTSLLLYTVGVNKHNLVAFMYKNCDNTNIIALCRWKSVHFTADDHFCQWVWTEFYTANTEIHLECSFGTNITWLQPLVRSFLHSFHWNKPLVNLTIFSLSFQVIWGGRTVESRKMRPGGRPKQITERQHLPWSMCTAVSWSR